MPTIELTIGESAVIRAALAHYSQACRASAKIAAQGAIIGPEAWMMQSREAEHIIAKLKEV